MTALFSLGCLNSERVPEPSSAVAAAAVCEREQADYFGVRADMSPDAKREASDWDFIAQFLEIMKQPPLSCGPAPDEVYRLVSLHHTGRPTFVSIQRVGRTATLSWTQLAGPSWAVSTLVLGEGMRPVNQAEWRDITEIVSTIGFWRMRRIETVQDWPGPSTAWVIEGRKKNVYHVVRRGEPRAHSLGELPNSLLKLAGLPLDSVAKSP